MMKTSIKIFLFGFGAVSLLIILFLVISPFSEKTETDINEATEKNNASELENKPITIRPRDPYKAYNYYLVEDDFFGERSYWEKDIERIGEGLDIMNYQPFDKSNKLATLDNESVFKLTENIPILDGATSFYPVYAAFAQAVYPPEEEYNFLSIGDVRCTRTAKAYNELLEGNVDLIFCMEPSKEQLQQFKDKNMNIKLVPIGREAFVFFVNVNNPVNSLTVKNIKGIYSGKVTNWNEVKGKDNEILAFQRPKNSGSQTILEKIMGDVPISKPLEEDLFISMVDIIQGVASYRNYENALGYSFLFFSTEMVKNNQIKLLSINGVKPSAATIKNKKYPYTVDFYAIYIEKDNKNKNIEPFIEWILSKQGQELVSKTGYVPVK